MKKHLLLLLFLLMIPLSLPARDRFVRVTAEAEVMAEPDRVIITAANRYKTANLQEGSQTLQKNISQALDFCRSQNINDSDIQIQHISITPSFYTDNGRQTDKPSYTLTQSFSITLKDLSRYEALLYGLLNNGINQIQDVRFYSSKLKEYRNEARTLAMQAAQEKAHLLAGQAQAQLGKVISITENTPAISYSAANISQNAYLNTEMGGAGAGVIPVRAEVVVQYELK